MTADNYHRGSKRINLGDFETEEDILDAIEQSRRITRLIISAVQKGSKFEVSQILEHYGLPMTSRLHFKVTNIVMEQWFSLMGIEDEEQIWNILKKNPYAMNKLTSIANAGGGIMQLSDMLTEWELGIGALQSKIIRRITSYCEEQKKKGNNDDAKEKEQNEDANSAQNDANKPNDNAKSDDNKDPEKDANANNNNNNDATANGSADDK
jgi:hypothetical protein